MTKRVRVNVRTAINAAAVRKTKRNGRDVLIVPSATLPDDVVMNDIMYPAGEIAKSFQTLNRTPAPAGHPSINGQFVSASDPEGINRGWIGAWNENVRQEQMPDGRNRVLIDKVIDVQRANESDRGRAVLAAIDQGDPIHTSTGLLCHLEDANGDVAYSAIARDIEFDHDAILIGEEGAATPEQGVGMLVNSNGDEEKIEVINSRVEWAEDDLAWAAEHLLDSAERLDKAKAREALIPRLVEALRGLMSGDSAETNETVQEETVMDEATQKAFEAVNTKVDGIADAVGNAFKEAIQPLVEAQNTLVANAKADAEAKKANLVAEVVNAKIEGMTEDVAKSMDESALTAMLNMHKAMNKPAAAPLTGGFFGVSNDGTDGFNPLGGAKQ